MAAEVLNELRYMCWRDLHLAVYRVLPFARGDNMYLIRHRRSRSFCEELHERNSLLAITLLLLHTLIIQRVKQSALEISVDNKKEKHIEYHADCSRFLQLLGTFALGSVVGSGLGLLALRTWVSEKIRAAIKQEYDEKLETHKAQLKSQYDVEIEELKSRLAIAAS